MPEPHPRPSSSALLQPSVPHCSCCFAKYTVKPQDQPGIPGKAGPCPLLSGLAGASQVFDEQIRPQLRAWPCAIVESADSVPSETKLRPPRPFQGSQSGSKAATRRCLGCQARSSYKEAPRSQFRASLPNLAEQGPVGQTEGNARGPASPAQPSPAQGSALPNMTTRGQRRPALSLPGMGTEFLAPLRSRGDPARGCGVLMGCSPRSENWGEEFERTVPLLWPTYSGLKSHF